MINQNMSKTMIIYIEIIVKSICLTPDYSIQLLLFYSPNIFVFIFIFPSILQYQNQIPMFNIFKHPDMNLKNAMYGGSMLFFGFLFAKLTNSSKHEPVQQKIYEFPQSSLTPQIATHLRTISHSTYDDNTVELPIRKVNYKNFKITYSTGLRIPLAVHQLITKDNINGDAVRKNKFFQEEQIPIDYRVNEDHYKKTKAYAKHNLSRGHMAAAGNYNSVQKDKDDTFTYANIVPQNSQNNQDTWVTFQTYSRQLTNKCVNVQIISGPSFEIDSLQPDNQYSIDKAQYLVLGKNGPAVPTHLYKIIKCNQKGQSYYSAFYFKNKESFDNNKLLKEFEIPIYDLELKTGLKFNLNGGSLVNFDSDLSLSKEDYDKKIFFPTITKASNYNQISSTLRKIYQHNIQVPSEIKKKIYALSLKKLQSIKTSQDEVCLKLSDALQTASNLKNIDNLTEQAKKYSSSVINQKYFQCKDVQVVRRLSQRFSTIMSQQYNIKLQEDLNKYAKILQMQSIVKKQLENLENQNKKSI